MFDLTSVFRPIKSKCEQIKVSVRGIDIMNDDPKCVRYLYGKIQSDALQEIGDGILKRFIDAGKPFESINPISMSWRLKFGFISDVGLAKREHDRDSVKLHMTLINVTNGSTDDDDGDGGGSSSRTTDANNRNKSRANGFDAQNILDKYADYEFGQQNVTKIHLAIMKSSDANNGFYKCTTSIQF